jgi:putative hydrolase of the HAD superfamily
VDGVKLSFNRIQPMIRAVIFDFGGTLAKTSTPWDTVSNRIAERLEYEDIKVDPVDLEEAINETIEYRYQQHQLGLELDSYQFFNHALEKHGHSVPVDITDELEQMVYEEGHAGFVENLDELLMILSEEYMLALLSNSWLEAPRQTLRDHGYGRWFKALICSYDIGIPKPDPRIFRHTIDILGVHASEAVMVGDSLEADIKGALAAGLQAVLIDDGFSEWSGPKIMELSELPELLRSMDV